MPRINQNISAMTTAFALDQVDVRMSKSLEKLSTGLRINRAADDAAGLSVSEQLRTQVRGIAMGIRNAQDGMQLTNIAEGALNEVSAMLQRMRELAIQASSDTSTSVERSYIQIEIDQLKIEIDRIANGTQYNSMKLLNGGAPWAPANGGGVIHVGPNNDVTADVITITIGGITVGGMGIAGTVVTSQTLAASAITELDGALTSVNSLRGYLGAITNRMEHALTNQQNQQTNMTAAESVIRDVDFGTATTEYTRNQIVTQSATAMLAQANQLPQSILGLLK